MNPIPQIQFLGPNYFIELTSFIPSCISMMHLFENNKIFERVAPG